MSGGSRIIAFGATESNGENGEAVPASGNGVTAPVYSADDVPWDAGEPDLTERSKAELIWPVVAAIVIIAWSGFFVWANLGAMATGLAPRFWASLVTEWAVPVLLVGVVWLLAMRSSRRETARFGDAARLLSAESSQLEVRLTAVNRELSLAREFIASQSRDLESLGRVATERLSQNADRLEQLIRDNGARVDTIGSVSQAALENMERLRGQLPVIASSAKDVTNNIATAGRTAHAQLEDLINGFNRLNEFGQASERQVASMRSAVDQALGEFASQSQQLDTIATQRFAALAERSAEFRTQLDSHEIAALAAIRTRSSALASEINDAQAQLSEHEAESLTSLRARLGALRNESDVISRALREAQERLTHDLTSSIAALSTRISDQREAYETAQTRLAGDLRGSYEALDSDLARRARELADEVEQRRVGQIEQQDAAVARLSAMLRQIDDDVAARLSGQEQRTTALADQARDLIGQLETYEQRLFGIASQTGESEARITSGLARLTDRLTSARATLAATDADIDKLTEMSVRLLELIQASATQSSASLPEALAISEDRLGRMDASIRSMVGAIGDAGTGSTRLAGVVKETGEHLRELEAELGGLQSAASIHSERYGATLAELRASLSEVEEQASRIADRSREELSQAIEQLSSSARNAVAAIEHDGAVRVAAVAEKLGEETGIAMDKALRIRVAEVSGQLEQAAAHASGVGRETAIQLRDQLTKVNELVANLESRVSHARQRAEEQIDNDFSRRVALITDSLNSNSIDIAKALSTEVSDTAWAAYLRGDRGIFTRRAVNLIDNGDARAIQQIYENDDEFRLHVSRYIHDFEAVLRQVLSTRDGNALGVTLLSSDMGKLYVALAQGIERLRS